MMSGIPESMVRRRARHYAAFVHKPFEFDELEVILRRVAARRRA